MNKAAALAAVFLLFGCQEAQSPAEPQPGTTKAAPAADVPPPRTLSAEPLGVDCAIGGGEFSRSCTVDQAQAEDGVTLTIRNPAGGFRRLLVTPAGDIAAADGAEPAHVTDLPNGQVEVRIGRDRYRLPTPARGSSSQGQ